MCGRVGVIAGRTGECPKSGRKVRVDTLEQGHLGQDCEPNGSSVKDFK